MLVIPLITFYLHIFLKTSFQFLSHTPDIFPDICKAQFAIFYNFVDCIRQITKSLCANNFFGN